MFDANAYVGLSKTYTDAANAMRDAMWAPDDLDYSVRELARIASAKLHGCRPCTAARLSEARDEGVTDEKVLSALGNGDRGNLSDREHLAVKYVERYWFDYSSIDAELLADMRAAFTERELAMLVSFVWYFAGRHKFFHLLNVPAPEVGENGTWTMTLAEAPVATGQRA